MVHKLFQHAKGYKADEAHMLLHRQFGFQCICMKKNNREIFKVYQDILQNAIAMLEMFVKRCTCNHMLVQKASWYSIFVCFRLCFASQPTFFQSCWEDVLLSWLEH